MSLATKVLASPWSNHAYCLEGIWTEPSKYIQSPGTGTSRKSLGFLGNCMQGMPSICDVETEEQIIVIVRHISGRGGRRGVENNKVINPFKDRVNTVHA